MAYSDAANYNTVKSMRGFPVGTIIPFSGSIENIPKGWISCNGANISITTYPLLYECIGNTYGGTVGSTFKLPNLLNGNPAIIDQYQGHFDYLQAQGDAHKPEFTTKSSDPYWKEVGGADNGNQNAVTGQTHVTEIDVHGEFTSKPKLVGKYLDFFLSEGSVDFSLTIVERKTSDTHIPSHVHSYTVENAPSYKRNTNKIATQNSDYFSTDNYYVGCYKDGNAANVCRSTNDPPIDGTQMASVGSSENVNTTFRKGGGQIISDNPVPPQYLQTTMGNGDGFSQNDMFSHIGGTKYFFSSLSNESTKFSDLSGHNHGAVDYTFESKIKVLVPGIVNDVEFNDVDIDNTPGKQFCVINMNSATPNLAVLFIIRAF